MMLISFFIINRLLITDLLLKPSELGIPINRKSNIPSNMKILASILNFILLKSFLKVARNPQDS